MPVREHPVDLSAPDISAYRNGNTGIDFVTTLNSGVPGPHVMINAVTHGNEICGAIALDHLYRHGIQPTRGTLTLAFVNHAAFHNFDPASPRFSRFVDQDINRVWAEDILDGPENSSELRRASSSTFPSCRRCSPWTGRLRISSCRALSTTTPRTCRC